MQGFHVLRSVVDDLVHGALLFRQRHLLLLGLDFLCFLGLLGLLRYLALLLQVLLDALYELQASLWIDRASLKLGELLSRLLTKF